MDRAKTLTRYLKGYDKELYAVCHKPPRIDVYRQNRDRLSPPHFIFSLTDDWTVNGKPIEWGVEPVLARLTAIDLWNNGIGVDALISQKESEDAAKQREFRTNVEGFLYDFRSQFAKATDGINTSLLSKKRKEI